MHKHVPSQNHINYCSKAITLLNTAYICTYIIVIIITIHQLIHQHVKAILRISNLAYPCCKILHWYFYVRLYLLCNT